MALFSRPLHSEPKTLSRTRFAFAVVGAGFMFYGARRQEGLLPKLAGLVGASLVARCLGATSLAGAPAILLGLLSRTKHIGSAYPALPKHEGVH